MDRVTIRFERGRVSARKLKRTIEGTGFEAIRRRTTEARKKALPTLLPPPPPDSPSFLMKALQNAKDHRRPVILDFHAPWCGPCRQLEAITLADARVKEALAAVEFIKIDLDQHPKLAAHYAVSSVPNLILADVDGRIVDRVLAFEDAGAFLARLRALSP